MSDDRLPATTFKPQAKSKAGEAARPTERQSETELTGQGAGMRRTVGVYERPEQRGKLSLPVIVILILVSLISVVLSVRFWF